MNTKIFTAILEALSKGRIKFFKPSESGILRSSVIGKEKFLPEKISVNKQKDIPIFTEAKIFNEENKKPLMYPLQSHPNIESIFKVSGDVDVFAEGKWLEAEHNYFYSFLPNAIHGEKFNSKKNPYRLLWIISLPQFINFHLTSYKPGKGYFLAGRLYNIQTPFNNQIWNFSARKSKHLDKMEQSNYQALMMQMFYYLIKNEDILETHVSNSPNKICQQVKDYIDIYFWQEDLSLQKIAQMFHYSSGHLNVSFRQIFNTPIHQYILKRRLQEAEKQLKSGDDVIIKEIAGNVGFKDPLYFSRLFKKHYGKSPYIFLEN